MKTKHFYPTKQQTLYTICNAAWILCLEHLAAFAAFKAIYTPQFVEDQQTAVGKAEGLPTVRESTNNRASARVDLMLGTRLVLKNWQTLKAYIQSAYIPEKVDLMLEAAGASLYKKAGQFNWDATRTLISAASNFIANNSIDLMKDDNMPATFQAKFDDEAQACIELATAFAEADMAKEMATSNKVDANNEVYESMVRMLKDGQQAFKDIKVIKRQFSVSYLVAVNSGEGSTSLTGYIRDENKLPIEGAFVISADGKYKATTNAKGHYRIARIAAGLYLFNVTRPGYQPVSQAVELTAGITSRENFVLSNLMMKVA